jgi:hypothetical protein
MNLIFKRSDIDKTDSKYSIIWDRWDKIKRSYTSQVSIGIYI